MKSIFHNFLFGVFVFVLPACAGYGPIVVGAEPDSDQMHAWEPPTQEELDSRRLRQLELDKIAAEIETIYLKSEREAPYVGRFQSRVEKMPGKFSSFESKSQGAVVKEENKINKLQGRLTDLKGSADGIDASIKAGFDDLAQAEKDREAALDYYDAAIQFFKNLNYKKSVTSFNKALKLNPPHSLLDKIYFGLGSGYFRLKDYSQAKKNFNNVVKQFPSSDKWFMSHVLLAWVHNHLGENSQALYILDRALANGPPNNIRRLIERLDYVIQGGNIHVGS